LNFGQPLSAVANSANGPCWPQCGAWGARQREGPYLNLRTHIAHVPCESYLSAHVNPFCMHAGPLWDSPGGTTRGMVSHLCPEDATQQSTVAERAMAAGCI